MIFHRHHPADDQDIQSFCDIMIKKIISGGQTGADQAALDAAIKLDIPHDRFPNGT
jgi:hypothetical protein